MNYKLEQKKRYVQAIYPDKELMPFFFPFNHATLAVKGIGLMWWKVAEYQQMKLFRSRLRNLVASYDPLGGGGRSIGARTWLLK